MEDYAIEASIKRAISWTIPVANLALSHFAGLRRQVVTALRRHYDCFCLRIGARFLWGKGIQWGVRVNRRPPPKSTKHTTLLHYAGLRANRDAGNVFLDRSIKCIGDVS